LTGCSAGAVEEGLRAPRPQSSSNSDAGIILELYEASEHSEPVLHYYVVVVDNTVAEQITDPNDFDIEQLKVYADYKTSSFTGGSTLLSGNSTLSLSSCPWAGDGDQGGGTYLRPKNLNAAVGVRDLAIQKAPEGYDRQTN